MPSFFIDRPIFAWVVAILISLGGVLAILNMGVESYPSIAPPSVTVSATYPGASAATTEKTVTQVIEQQLTGIDHLLYFSSSSSASGRASITLTFESGTDPDIAQVQVQNKVALATPRLPSEVTQQGVVVAKANAGFLMVVALTTDNPEIDRNRLNDIVGSSVLDQIARVPGVGSTQQFGSEYAMRIWLNPDKLQGYNLSATQVLAAIRATKAVKGFAHITGGGFPDNIPRVLPKGMGARIDLTRVTVPPIFKWLADAGNIAQNEMLRTFNCGIGMVAVTSPKDVDAVSAALTQAGEQVAAIGTVIRARGDDRVVYDGTLALK